MNTTKAVIGLVVVAIIVAALFLLLKNNDTPNTQATGTENVSRHIADKPENQATEIATSGHHDGNNPGFEIYPGDVVNKIKNNEDIILLDVRRPDEYETVHLEDARLLPVEELSVQTLETIGLGADMKDKEIILYCRSGARSQVAYNIMTSLGYTNLKSIQGGMIHWQEDGYPYTASGVYSGPAWNTNANVDKSPVTTSGAEISIPNDFYDFGVIPRSGGTVLHEFIISNPGSENLEVGSLTTSCSCTTASIDQNIIRPGESATLTVIFDPDFHEEPLGQFKRTVFIPTNDPNTPEAEVVIQVDIDEGN